MSLPGDIARTEFRLVVTHDGWEYCILERNLGAHSETHRNMLVTVPHSLRACHTIKFDLYQWLYSQG